MCFGASLAAVNIQSLAPADAAIGKREAAES
jgi:hypothetical protein